MANFAYFYPLTIYESQMFSVEGSSLYNGKYSSYKEQPNYTRCNLYARFKADRWNVHTPSKSSWKKRLKQTLTLIAQTSLYYLSKSLQAIYPYIRLAYYAGKTMMHSMRALGMALVETLKLVAGAVLSMGVLVFLILEGLVNSNTFETNSFLKTTFSQPHSLLSLLPEGYYTKSSPIPVADWERAQIKANEVVTEPSEEKLSKKSSLRPGQK